MDGLFRQETDRMREAYRLPPDSVDEPLRAGIIQAEMEA